MSTFVLTDVVWSAPRDGTADMAITVLARHVAILRGVVARFGGTMAPGRHDAASTLTAFTRATDAMSAVRAAQRALATEGWPEGLRPAVRFAVETGDAVERRGEYSGPAIERVVRLRDRAGADDIVCSQATVDALGEHGLDGVTLDPLPGTGETVYLMQSTDGAAAPAEPLAATVALPSRLQRAPISGFQGRDAQRELLGDAMRDVAGGGVRVVFIGGEAGIGKTSLAADAARSAHAAGAVVLHGECDEDAGIPYQPWIEAVAQLATHADDDMIERLSRCGLVELPRFVPALRMRLGASIESPAPKDPETERYVFFGEVVTALSALAGPRPVVLILEDLHWADRPTLLLLRHVTSAWREPGLLVVGTYRDDELPGSTAEQLATMANEPGVDAMVLGGLSVDELVMMVEVATGQRLAGAELELARVLHRETDGNPFFAWELLLHLSETGAVALGADGRWVVQSDFGEQPLPDSVREVVQRRVRRLGPDVERVLVLAAVIGPEFELALLAVALDTPADAVLAALEDAETVALVARVGTGRFGFVHSLVAHTLYRDLSATRRARAHRSVAAAIERMGPTDERVAQLAHHWSLAAVTAADAARVVDYATKAGDQAMAALAPDAACRWYERARDRLAAGSATEPQRCELLLRLGVAQRHAGDPGARRTLLDAAALAQRLGDRDQLVRAALASNRGIGVGAAVDDERITVLEAALAGVDENDLADRARLLATLAVELIVTADFARRRRLADEAVVLARRSGDRATLVAVLGLWAPATAVPETLDERLSGTAEMLSLAQTLGDPMAEFVAAQQHAAGCLEAGAIGAVEPLHARMTELADALKHPTLRWIARWTEASRHLLAGDAREAERLAGEALKMGLDSGEPDALTIYGGQLFGIRLHQGREPELMELIAQVAAESPNISALRAGLSLIKVAAGRADEVSVEVGDIDAIPYDYSWPAAVAPWSEVAVRLGATAVAQRLYDLLLPHADQVVSVQAICQGAFAHYLGMLATAIGDHAAAHDHFVRADAIHERLRAPFHQARTYVEWAELLRRRGEDGDAAEAARLLEAALALARAHDCRGVEQRATAALAN